MNRCGTARDRRNLMRMAGDDSEEEKHDQFPPCGCDRCLGRGGRIDLDHPGVLWSRGRYRIRLRLLALRPPAVSYPCNRGDFLRRHHDVPHLSAGPFEKHPLELGTVAGARSMKMKRRCVKAPAGTVLAVHSRQGKGREDPPMRVSGHAT